LNYNEAVKVVVERNADGFVAYPIGVKGIVVGQGDTFEEALANVKSAIQFHIETFGPSVVEDAAVLDATVVEVQIAS